MSLQTNSGYGLKVARVGPKSVSVFCPFHKDDHASGFIYKDNLWFVCPVCQLSMPLEKALDMAGIQGIDVERSLDIEELDLMCDAYRVKPLTKQAIEYLKVRGIEGSLPSYLYSPLSDKGVAFAFRNSKGMVVGSQIRLFPENVVSGYRYIFEGKRLPYFGELSEHYRNKTKLFVFEKAFATLKADIAAKAYGLNVTAISAVGSHFQNELLQLTDIDTVFFFDNDTAGMNSAKNVKKITGARVIIPARPLDELSIEEMHEFLQKYMG